VTLQGVVSRLITDPDFEKSFSLDNFFNQYKDALANNVSQ